MVNLKNAAFKSAKAVASLALKKGIASSNSVCRDWYYQPKVPESMKQFKK